MRRRSGRERVGQGRAVDVVIVRVASTTGHRRSEEELLRALDDLGCTWVAASTDYGLLGRLPLSLNLLDLGHAASIRWATTRTLKSVSPRAIIYGAAGATLLEPTARLERAAVRVDAFAVENRQGRRHVVQRALERRAVPRARMLLPFATLPAFPAQAPVPKGPIVPLPTPVEPCSEMTSERDRIAVCYAGAPEKKGLELIIEAWHQARVPTDFRLLVTGIEEAAGRVYLSRKRVSVPANVIWCGPLPPEDYRSLLERAELYIAASRFEDYGIAQLEALAAGAVLVTVPSLGPYEALALARRLEPGLVANAVSGSALVPALEHALELDAHARHLYRQQAMRLTAPYSRAAFRERLRSQVLPVLLEDQVSAGAVRPTGSRLHAQPGALEL